MHLERGDILSNREISRIFHVCTKRGIRYHGSLRNGIKHVVLITVLHKTPEESVQNPYNDRVTEKYLLYTGEGRVGNQKMERGNLALKIQMEKKYPVYVFEKKTPGRYMFLGQYDVKSVQEEIQQDVNRLERKVYLYKLEKVSDLVILH
ncbi:MAG: YDG/SRA domain-containing protein [Candidatus Bathyarchaeia archaeon]